MSEPAGLEIVDRFLAELSAAGDSAGHRILRNHGKPPRSRLPLYHALIEFADAAALDAAMKTQSQRGIFNGLHGAVVNAVCDFHVEVFSEISTPHSQESSEASPKD
ncbi:MAG: hypothetical protein J6386_17575 [Candidatus Synoicihabitans palmerolidicus]|nr:hypothetical protein [Candidatus Synoicihabitans palmerolidicus]